MSDCTDVCEVVMDVLIGLGYSIKTEEGDEDHADVLDAFSKYSQSHADLLGAAQEILSDFQRYGEVLQVGDNGEYGLESAIGRLTTAITKAEPQQADEPERMG